MRKDLIFYIIAGTFFIITAIALVLATEQLYIISTAVAGLAFATAGLFLKPKAAAATIQPTQSAPATAASAPEAPQAAVSVAPVETPVAIVPKVETPLAETPAASTAIAEASVPQTAIMTENTSPTPVSAAEPSIAAPVQTTTADFSKIHGINAKRAEQLKANGVNSVEELAKASPVELAAKLQVSEKIVKMWVGSAKKQVKYKE